MMPYTEEFYADNHVTLLSAEIVLPTILEWTKAKRVIDVGCGSGAWSKVALDTGCEVCAIDGYTSSNQLLIPSEHFICHDLNYPINCKGFDLAICLEVGEHLPPETAEPLVKSLCEARWVLWSAAIPSQGGLNHVNEQWATWWWPKFERHGKVGSSALRTMWWSNPNVATCYRQNLVLYASPDDLTHLGLNVGVYDEIHPRGRQTCR